MKPKPGFNTSRFVELINFSSTYVKCSRSYKSSKTRAGCQSARKTIACVTNIFIFQQVINLPATICAIGSHLI